MADGFLSRWSRLKSGAGEQPPPSVPLAPSAADGGTAVARQEAHDSTQDSPRILPTLEDAKRLGPQSDYSAFVARDVDPSVRRLALRKLFSDPHFNIGDGLDVYMGDYNRSDPVSPAMLASLAHAGKWLGLGPKDDEADAGGLSPAPRRQYCPRPLHSAADVEMRGTVPEGQSPIDQMDQQQPEAQRAAAREHDEY